MFVAPNPIMLRQWGAFAAVGMIFLAMALKGADGAALAALFGAGMALLLALEILSFPGARLLEAARRNRITLAAAGGFCLWTLLTAWPVDADAAPAWWRALWHPMWAEFGIQRGAISLSPYRTLEGLAAFAAPAAAFALGALNTTDRQERDRLGRLFVGCAIGIAALSLGFHLAGVMQQPPRLSGAFNSPNSAATLFGALALMMTALIVRAARGKLFGVNPAAAGAGGRWLGFVYAAPVTTAALAFVVVCLLLTGSRAGIAAFAGAAFLFYTLVRPRSRRSGARLDATIWTFAGIGAFLLLIGGDFILSRFVFVDIDANARGVMIDAHWRAFLERPLLGHGLNTFHEINLHHTTAENWRVLHIIGAAHNIFVQTLEENGLLGFAFFAAMLAPPLWRAVTIVRLGGSGAEWAAATIAVFAFAFAHGLVDFGLQVPATGAMLAYALGAFGGGADAPTAAKEPAANNR